MINSDASDRKEIYVRQLTKINSDTKSRGDVSNKSEPDRSVRRVRL